VSDHPTELWTYALGDLDARRAQEVEAHLADCRGCRRQVRAWRAELVAAVGALTPVVPSDAARARALAAGAAAMPATGAPVRPRPASTAAARWLAPARSLAAVLAIVVILTSSGVAWQRHHAWRAVEAERALVAAWLTRDDVVSTPLPRPEAGARSPGTVMVARDGVVLVVMRGTAPDGGAFQVWGHDPSGPTSLGTVRGTVLRADAARFSEVWVTLEPSGGSPAPSTLLGKVPVGS
jgi:anti-sigma factor RsiW